MKFSDLIPQPFVSDVCLWINPKQIELTEHQYGWRQLAQKTIADRKVFERKESEPLAESLNAVQTVLLKKAKRSSVRIRVIFSNHYNRYVLMPWNASLTSHAEVTGYAKLLMEEHFGGAASNWRLGINSLVFESATLVSGVEQTLIDELERVFIADNLSLVAAIPLQILAINHAIAYLKRNKLEPDCWLVCIESQRLVLALIVKNECRLIQNFAVDVDIEKQMCLALQRAVVITRFERDVPILRFGLGQQQLSDFRISQIMPKEIQGRQSRLHLNAILR